MIELANTEHKYTSILNKQLEHIGYKLISTRSSNKYTFTLEKKILNFININE